MRVCVQIQLSDDETVNVMKIRVDGDHTFLQANGVVTHNCGGDLKFHLINAGRFTEKRARFYAAQVLLGLEHVHALSIIYRDMKLENVLLDHAGQVRITRGEWRARVCIGRGRGRAGVGGAAGWSGGGSCFAPSPSQRHASSHHALILVAILLVRAILRFPPSRSVVCPILVWPW